MSQTHAGPDGRVWQGRGRAALGFDALAADVGAGPDAGACLLPDLAGQGLLQGLAGLDGAAGKRPVGGVPGHLDKGLEGRGGSGVWGRVAGRGGHGRRRRLVSGSTPRSMRSTPSLNWWFMSHPPQY